MLTIYAPPNKAESKCWEIFNPLFNGGWPNVTIERGYKKQKGPGMFWGFVGDNMKLILQYQENGETWYFADMPYFGRYKYWRIIKNKLHANTNNINWPDNRWLSHNITLHDWNDKGDHILICPSSPTMTKFYYGYDDKEWIKKTIDTLKKHTDRPIRVRHKPRGNGTSGPAAALIPFEEDIKGAHAIVTSVSIAAIEAAIMGIPVFCNPLSGAGLIGLSNITKIETPFYPNRQKWLNNLCYSQFTPEEIQKGMVYEILSNS